jgi:hypothetical protein
MPRPLKTVRYCPMIRVLLLLCLLLTACACSQPGIEALPRTRCFDSDWRFLKDSISGVERPAYDGSRWRQFDLPHD